MPIKCYYKPNRAVPYPRRQFHASDAARVTRYAVISDGKPNVAKAVLDELQLRTVMCAMLRVIAAVDRLEDKVGQAKALSALLTIISGLVRILKRLPTGKFNWLGVLLIVLGILQGMLTGLKEVLDEFEPVQDVVEALAPLCDKSTEK